MMTDYMSRPDEIAKHSALALAKGLPDSGIGSLKMVQTMAGDDADFFDIAWSAWNFEHAWDDLYDESRLDKQQRLFCMTQLHDLIVKTLTETPAHDVDVKQIYPKNFRECWKFMLARVVWSKDRAIMASTARNRFFESLMKNAFVRERAAEFRTLFVQCILRNMAGDEMAASDKPERRMLAPAVRCADVDMFLHMIYMRRGWGTATIWTHLREYDIDTPKAAS